MKSYHRITQKESSLENTFNHKDIEHIRVLTKNGRVLGRVSEIRIHPETWKIEGVVISRGILRKPFYIGSSYLDRFSKDSAILKIEPTVLLVGRKVITSDGEPLGKIVRIARKSHTNDLDRVTVRSLRRSTFDIPVSQIKYFGESVILKSSYNVPKKYFWQKNK